MIVNSQPKYIISVYCSLQEFSAEMAVFRKYKNVEILGRLINTYEFRKKGDFIITFQTISVHNFRVNNIYET